jgi:hypothetical protein
MMPILLPSLSSSAVLVACGLTRIGAHVLHMSTSTHTSASRAILHGHMHE